MEILTNLVGISFRPVEAKEVVRNLSIGDQLGLEPEPTNAYDSNAVKVVTFDTEDAPGEFIGYIPRDDNAEISAHLLEGGEYTCEVVSFLGTLKPGLKVTLA